MEDRVEAERPGGAEAEGLCKTEGPCGAESPCKIGGPCRARGFCKTGVPSSSSGLLGVIEVDLESIIGPEGESEV